MSIDVDAIVPGHGPVSTKKDVKDMKEYLIAFDRKARELAAGSKDTQLVAACREQSVEIALGPQEETRTPTGFPSQILVKSPDIPAAPTRNLCDEEHHGAYCSRHTSGNG